MAGLLVDRFRISGRVAAMEECIVYCKSWARGSIYEFIIRQLDNGRDVTGRDVCRSRGLTLCGRKKV